MKRSTNETEVRLDPEATLLTIAQATPERAVPGCRHFGTCGGCQLQHLPPNAQLAGKRSMLIDVLSQVGIDPPQIQVHAAEPWRYRNRARMRVQNGRIGYNLRSSNEFLPIEECPIVSPLIWHTASRMEALAGNGKAVWPADTGALELFANEDESELQMTLHLDATVGSVDRDAPRDLRAMCETLQANVPQLKGAGLSVAAAPDPSQTRRVQESRRVEIAQWGEAALRYHVNGRAYTITRNAFFQVNRYLTGEMVEAVVGDRHGRLAFDLFAGAGLFSVPLSERFAEVVAVEIGEPAASNLARHLHQPGSPHRAVQSTALDFLRRQELSPARVPGLVVVDPPRAGLGPATVRALLRANAQEIVYVSCDISTFARDAVPLMYSGYTLASLHLFDLFPQTFHTETIATFRRK